MLELCRSAPAVLGGSARESFSRVGHPFIASGSALLGADRLFVNIIFYVAHALFAGVEKDASLTH